ncbi:CBO0543 family protein [Bacillus taeanensis]|uniref:ABC transporter permease n=1 Tax=Bacillus taeanensis TaxID=273032 RepID=A0A366XU40_9BACI|nr:CBO0543 family protein [Bacillus taeanensis]RBW69652.1 hypothetical protein DS031_10535 [Bacillus taeanensis]
MAVNDFSDLQYELTQLRIEHWLHQELFSFQWWILVFTFIVPWLIWWKLVDKKRIIEIMLYGIILMYIATMLDAAGTELKLWEYSYKEISLYNRLMAVNIGALPVIYMIIYQYANNWKRFIFVSVITAAAFSFVFEPFFQWIGIYNTYHWKSIYSFPIYILLGVLIKGLIEKCKKVESSFN